jgi:predicted ribosomally synthesized peptide with nif11-like leader
MSKENLDQFIQKVTDSEELQARIGEEMDADEFITLGAEYDCEFTADDLTAGSESTDDELDGVAGGALCIHTNVASFKQNGTKYWIGNKYNPGKGVNTSMEMDVTMPSD